LDDYLGPYWGISISVAGPKQQPFNRQMEADAPINQSLIGLSDVDYTHTHPVIDWLLAPAIGVNFHGARGSLIRLD